MAPAHDNTEERKFLHAISTPVSTLGLLIDTLETDSKTARELKACLDKVIQLIRERREKIKS